MWVVCAFAVAKLLAPSLLNATSGWLHKALSSQIGLNLTSDRLGNDLFNRQVLWTLTRQLIFTLLKDFSRLICGSAIELRLIGSHILYKILIPEQYWSGCPPPYAV